MSHDNALQRLMRERDLTIHKVSELSGVSTLALEYLLAKHCLPKPHVAQKIAKTLQVKVSDLWPELTSSAAK
jgi:lambda repressor-like predicted transcriptional regulator